MIHNPQPSGNKAEPLQPFVAPAITLPKGGGAIRGIGENFAVNPVTGTGSLTVPIGHVAKPLRLWSAMGAFLRF